MKHSVLLTLAIIISTLCSNAQSLYVSSMKGNVNLRPHRPQHRQKQAH